MQASTCGSRMANSKICLKGEGASGVVSGGRWRPASAGICPLLSSRLRRHQQHCSTSEPRPNLSPDLDGASIRADRSGFRSRTAGSYERRTWTDGVSAVDEMRGRRSGGEAAAETCHRHSESSTTRPVAGEAKGTKASWDSRAFRHNAAAGQLLVDGRQRWVAARPMLPLGSRLTPTAGDAVLCNRRSRWPADPRLSLGTGPSRRRRLRLDCGDDTVDTLRWGDGRGLARLTAVLSGVVAATSSEASPACLARTYQYAYRPLSRVRLLSIRPSLLPPLLLPLPFEHLTPAARSPYVSAHRSTDCLDAGSVVRRRLDHLVSASIVIRAR